MNCNETSNLSDTLSNVTMVNDSMLIPYITEAEVVSVIKSLKNSSAGYDVVPASIAKLLINSYIKPLTYLINKSIVKGIFPSELKVAKVIPIFKSGPILLKYQIIVQYQFFNTTYYIRCSYYVLFKDNRKLEPYLYKLQQ